MKAQSHVGLFVTDNLIMEIVTRILIGLIVLILISPYLNPEIKEEKNNTMSNRSQTEVKQKSKRSQTEEKQKKKRNLSDIELLKRAKKWIKQ